MRRPNLMGMAKEILCFVKTHSKTANQPTANNHLVASRALICLKPLAKTLIAMSQQSIDKKGYRLYGKKYADLVTFMWALQPEHSPFFHELLQLKVVVPGCGDYSEISLYELFDQAEAARKAHEARYALLRGQSKKFVAGLSEQQRIFLKDFVVAGLTFSVRDFK